MIITEQAIRFTYNDGGRSAAGFKGQTGDCAARAVAIATGRPYREVYDEMIEFVKANERPTKRQPGRSHPRTGFYGSTFRKYMEAIGAEWVPVMKIGSGCTMHLRHNELPTGRLIVSLSKHYAAVIDRTLHDTYDCSRDGTRCVYGYWIVWEGDRL